MSVIVKDHLVVSADMQVKFPPETVWPQLCPTREYDWIEVWNCKLLHSESGFNELDCVFTTDFPTEGSKETWVTSRFDPYERIEFIRTNELRTIRFEILLEPNEQGTRITWTQYITALNDDGRNYLKDKPESFKTQMAMLGKMLDYYLETGEMMPSQELGLLERIKTHVHGRKIG